MEGIREEYVRLALESFSSLAGVLTRLTEEELFAALELESQSRRRRMIMNRLVGRAARLRSIKYKQELERRYGTQPLSDP